MGVKSGLLSRDLDKFATLIFVLRHWVFSMFRKFFPFFFSGTTTTNHNILSLIIQHYIYIYKETRNDLAIRKTKYVISTTNL